jgi:hypothetical protein
MIEKSEGVGVQYPPEDQPGIPSALVTSKLNLDQES